MNGVLLFFLSGCIPSCALVCSPFHNNTRKNSKSQFAYHLWFAWKQRRIRSTSPPCVPRERSSACLNEPSPCLHLFRQRGRNQQAGTDQILSKNDISRNSCRLWHWEERRERKRREEREREREENNWPEATREREVTWLLSWPRAREGSSRKGWSSQSGLALLLLLGPSVAFLSSLSPLLLLPVLLPALLPVTAHYIGTKWSALTSSWTRVIMVAMQRLGPLY